MSKRLLFIPITIIFLIIFAVFVFLLHKNSLASETKLSGPQINQITGRNLIRSPIDNYYASRQSTRVLAAAGKSDTRPVIIDNFLARHNSPMSGLGVVFVSTADRYGLDYRLLPAIAFQESTLGKKIPRNSHNAWGWAIYTGAQSGARFKDWTHAIDTVAQGLKYDYIDRGLNTPEAIMTRYADSPDGSWAFGVQFAIGEMTSN